MKPTRSLLITFAFLIGACAAPTTTATPRPQPEPESQPQIPPTPTPPPATATSLPPTETPIPEIWTPALGDSFSWQLGGNEEINTSFDVAIFDLDAFETEASLISRLHSQGKKVICYISVGSWEDWRPDAADFPPEVIGNDYEGWEGEKWLDIRQIDLLAPIMRARMDICVAKGFDGIEPDNIDIHWANTGFDISYEDQLAYNIWLAEEAHQRGLAIGLKNNDEQVRDLLPYFDFALTEDCFDDEWCEEMLPFIEAGKPVFAAEYTDRISYEKFIAEICPQAEELGIYAFLKNRNLDEYRADCP